MLHSGEEKKTIFFLYKKNNQCFFGTEKKIRLQKSICKNFQFISQQSDLHLTQNLQNHSSWE